MTARLAPYFPGTATGDGTTKNFILGFPIIDNAHLRVIVNGVLMVLGTDYNIQDAAPVAPAMYTSHVPGADTSKKHVAFVTAPANTYAIKFYRNTPIGRPSPSANIQMTDHMVAMYSHFRQQEKDDAIIKLVQDFGQTALLASTALSFVAPCDGYVVGIDTYVTKAVTTGGTLTAKIDGTTVTGCVATIANSAVVGSIVSATPSAAQASYTAAKRGQTITVLPASFATAGDVRVELGFQPADLS